MTDLPGFLLARIAEDEAVARDAGSGAWHWEQGYGELCNDPECPFGSLMQTKADGELYQLMEVHGYDTQREWEGADHIARWDPAHVLAECEAKKQIVSWCVDGENGGPWESFDGIPNYREPLRSLALPYADHPDYDEEWKP